MRVAGVGQVMSVGGWVLLAVVVGVGAFGAWRRFSDGRFAGRRRSSEQSVLAGTSYDERRGERATLLQFSSAFCAPCRATRQTLAEVARSQAGVAHVEVDAESNLDLVRRLGVLRTPTTLVLDAEGREVTRAAGAPRRDDVLRVLASR